MAKFWAPLQGEGRVTVPAHLRKKLKLRKGDWIHFEILEVEKAEKGEEGRE